MTLQRRFYLRDAQGQIGTAGQLYDVSGWVPVDRLKPAYTVNGQASGLTVPFNSTYIKEGEILVEPQPGMEGILVDEDAGGNHALDVFLFAGRLQKPDITPTMANKAWVFSAVDFLQELNQPVPPTSFPQDTYATESDIIYALPDIAGLANWDFQTFVPNPGYITYDAGTSVDFGAKSVRDILDALSADTGSSGNIAPRIWYIGVGWKNVFDPTQGITRYLYYTIEADTVVELVPLTDDIQGLANYAADSFIGRAPSATSLGYSDTAWPWNALAGTWGLGGMVQSLYAYLVTASGLYNFAVTRPTIADADRVGVTLLKWQSGAGVAFRVSDASNSWYFMPQSGSPNHYSLVRRQAGTSTTVASYSTLPADGDVIGVSLSGSTITPYINGVAQTPFTSTFNQTATMHGLYALGTGVGQFTHFFVRGVGARFTDGKRTPSIAFVRNLVAVVGPNSVAAPVSWQNATNSSTAAGTIRKTLEPSVWVASHNYVPGDVVVEPANPQGPHYYSRYTFTSGSSAPTFNTTEGGYTSDGSTPISDAWVTKGWDAGAVSATPITDDGGAATFTIEQTTLAADTFNRADNRFSPGVLETGQTWQVIFRSAETTLANWGISNHLLYNYQGDGPSFCVADMGNCNPILVGRFTTGLSAMSMMVFRVTDASNLLALRRESTGYTIRKRVAGTWSQIGTVTVTPSNSDELKVACAGSSIKLYINNAGSPSITVTETFNQGATMHGYGMLTGAGFNTGRFGSLYDYSTYPTAAVGIGTDTTVQSYADMDYCWYMKADRTIQPYEAGVAKGTAITGYSRGDKFKVECKHGMVGQHDHLIVKYWRQPAGTHNWILHYTSATYPTYSEATPAYVQVAIYNVGDTLNQITLERFTYSVFPNNTSIDEYGLQPADSIIQDDKLDSVIKRRERAQDYFAQNDTRDAFTCATYQDYTTGRRVLINSAKLEYTDHLMLLSQKDPSFVKGNPLLARFSYTFGDPPPQSIRDLRRRVTTGQLGDRTVPDVPSGFTFVGSQMDGEDTANLTFSCDVQVPHPREIHIQLQPQRQAAGGYVPDLFLLFPFPGDQTTFTIPHMPLLQHGVARIEAVGYNGISSGYSDSIPYQVSGLPDPPYPNNFRWVADKLDKGGTGTSIWAWDPVAVQGLTGYILEAVAQGGTEALNNGIRTYWVPAGETILAWPGFPLNVPYIFQIKSEVYGIPGTWSAGVLHTVKPLAPTVTGAHTTTAIDTTAGFVYNGDGSTKVSIPTGDGPTTLETVLQSAYAGQQVSAKVALRVSATGTTPTAQFVFYDQAGSTVGSPTSIYSGTPSTSTFTPTKATATMPAGATQWSVQYTLPAPSSGTLNYWAATPEMKTVAESTDVADGAINDSKVSLLTDVTKIRPQADNSSSPFTIVSLINSVRQAFLNFYISLVSGDYGASIQTTSVTDGSGTHSVKLDLATGYGNRISLKNNGGISLQGSGGGIDINGGTEIQGHLSGTVSISNGLGIAANAVMDTICTVTGAAVGDVCYASPGGAIGTGLVWCAWIAAANQITIRIANVTTSTKTLTTQTWRADCWKH